MRIRPVSHEPTDRSYPHLGIPETHHSVSHHGTDAEKMAKYAKIATYQMIKLSDFLAIGPATLAGKRATVPGSKSNGHVLPQIILTGSQSLPALTRSKDNRGNAYLPPDAARDPSSLTLPSFDCNNSGVKGPTNTPGCNVAKPLPFQGRTDRFPQVRAAAPGGANSGG